MELNMKTNNYSDIKVGMAGFSNEEYIIYIALRFQFHKIKVGMAGFSNNEYIIYIALILINNRK